MNAAEALGHVPEDGRMLCPVTEKREKVKEAKPTVIRRRCCTHEGILWLCDACQEWHKKKIRRIG